MKPLSGSAALWNRERLALDSDEVLAQILDRGGLEDWREIYGLASDDTAEAARLRRRIVRLCQTVPIAFPNLFLAAMASLGERLEPFPEVAPGDDATA